VHSDGTPSIPPQHNNNTPKITLAYKNNALPKEESDDGINGSYIDHDEPESD